MGKTTDYRTRIADYIRAEAKPVDKYSHQPRLYHLAVKIGQGQEFDDDVLYAAAWLHDLGVFIGHRPEDPQKLAHWDNVAYALAKAPEILTRCGFPPAKIAATLETIRHHLPDNKPTLIEAILLHDADILEQLGAVGVMRALSKVGRDTRYETFADAVKVLQRNVEVLPTKLNLPAARELARERMRLMQDFLRAAEKESGGQPL